MYYFFSLVFLSSDVFFRQVNGVDVTNVPQHVFFNLLRAADKVAKIQILKIPVSKVCCVFFNINLLIIIYNTTKKQLQQAFTNKQ